ncbi:MAG: diacylglycerol kinase family protein [Pirellulales bacterium]|nr:diacylglycerol kinase family protein [Pirellulales bacterium]
MLDDSEPPLTRSWSAKFGDAFRGVREEIHSQRSFRVHFAAGLAVIVCGFALRVNLLEWCVLLLCIIGVFIAEMFNTAMEALARAITRKLNRHIALALDVASAAVLMASIGAAMVGAIVFINRLGILLRWWG